MKTAYLVGPMNFTIEEVEIPSVPEDGLILNVKACGVCGSDLRRWKEGDLRGANYVIPGHEVAGEIIAVGKKIQDKYSIGERLAIAPDIHCGECFYCKRGYFNLCNNLKLVGISPEYPGGFSEQMVLPAEVLTNGIVHKIPAGMDYKSASLAEPCSSVIASHLRFGTNASHTILIMGGGPIGCIHIAIAKAHGARVLLSEPLAIRREKAKIFMPDLIIDPEKEDVKEVVMKATNGLGVDMVVCANPIAATHTLAVEVVKKRGTVVLFGGLPKSSPMTTIDANLVHYGEITITGSFSYSPTIHQLALDMILRGLIPAEKLITHVFSLDQIEQAFRTAASGEALKVIVEMNKEN